MSCWIFLLNQTRIAFHFHNSMSNIHMNMICVSLGTLPNSMLEVVLSNNNKHCKAHFEKVDSRKV